MEKRTFLNLTNSKRSSPHKAEPHRISSTLFSSSSSFSHLKARLSSHSSSSFCAFLSSLSLLHSSRQQERRKIIFTDKREAFSSSFLPPCPHFSSFLFHRAVDSLQSLPSSSLFGFSPLSSFPSLCFSSSSLSSSSSFGLSD
ncbi:hypothetical protein CSUI_010080, partial [Cystoisospora suis]